MSASRALLLKRAVRLVPTHGFTRHALALSPLRIEGEGEVGSDASRTNEDERPLSDTALDALFGVGDDARRTLVDAWLEHGLTSMDSSHAPGQAASPSAPPASAAGPSSASTLKTVLLARLRYNEPVLSALSEAFALLATPTTRVASFNFNLPVPPLDPRPALSHAFRVADAACRLSGDAATGTEWYARRASLAAVYGAAELHQLSSPSTAEPFLAHLLQSREEVQSAVGDAGQFAGYVGRSWAGIVRSAGVI